MKEKKIAIIGAGNLGLSATHVRLEFTSSKRLAIVVF